MKTWSPASLANTVTALLLLKASSTSPGSSVTTIFAPLTKWITVCTDAESMSYWRTNWRTGAIERQQTARISV